MASVSGCWLWLFLSPSMFILLVVLSTTLWFLFKSVIQKSRRHSGRPLPGPRGLPLVGYLPFLGSDLHRFFMELARTYGPIYGLPIGMKLYVIISSPALAKEVVREQDITFANRNPNVAALAFSYGGNDIAFSPYGPQWRMLRKLFVREMQSRANLETFSGLRSAEVEKSVREVYSKNGTPLDVAELAFSTVIGMISGMLWGGTIEEEPLEIQLRSEFREAVLKLTKILGKPNLSDFFPVLARFDLLGVERDMKEVSLWLGRIFDVVISRHEKSIGREEPGVNTRRDFLQFLLEYRDPETGNSISKEQIKALLMDIVIGGTGTTTTMIEWSMTEIMLHPKIIQHIHRELDQIVGADNMVQEFHLTDLPYLHAVVKEALRLHPAAPLLLPRSPSRSCTVGGFTIPEGTKVFLNVWAMHRDPEFWYDPDKFRPERFLDNEGIKLSYFGETLHYLPFGSGRRICAGLPLGERMLMYVLATFLHLFEWELPKGLEMDSKEKFGIVLEKSTPLLAIPTPRVPRMIA